MLQDQLKQLKAEKNMTAQDIADRSGVPLSTVNKILQGQTDSPSFRAVCDIVVALEGSVDELLGLRSRQSDADLLETILAPYREAIEAKNRWILRLFVFSCTLVAFLMLLTILDLTRPAAGWIR